MAEALDLINLDRYPIDALESPQAAELIAACRRALAAESIVNLPGFVADDKIALLVQEAMATKAQAYRKRGERTAYFCGDDVNLAPDHPRRRFFRIAMSQVAGDLIAPTSNISLLYASTSLIEFLRQVLDLKTLHCRADVFQNINYIFLEDGDVQPWHYDQNQFSVTLLLQAPETGGEFEVVPNLRSASDEHFEEVKEAFREVHPRLHRPVRSAGTLTVFRGEHSLHRVTEVEGNRHRISAILSYDETPGLWASRAENVMIYGPRVKAIMKRMGNR